MSRSGRPRGGARRVRAERGPARRAAGVLPARSGRPSSGPGRSDRRGACGGVRAPSPGALPGRGLPGGGGRRLPGPARRGVGSGKPGLPFLVAHALRPLGRRQVPADLRHVDDAQRPLVQHRRLQHLREGPRGGGARGHPTLQLAVPGGGVDGRGRCPRQRQHHRDRGADLLAERRHCRQQLCGFLRRGLEQRGEPEERIGGRFLSLGRDPDHLHGKQRRRKRGL